MREQRVYDYEVREIVQKGQLPDVKTFPYQHCRVPLSASIDVGDAERDRNGMPRMEFTREAVFEKDVGPDGELRWILVTPCVVGR